MKTLLYLVLAISAAAEPLQLADQGRAMQSIIVSANASDATKACATELATYLERISGARFAVQSGDGARGIVLGTLAEFPNESLNKALELRGLHDGKEAFAIRTEPQRVLLIGATDLGATHAAMRILEHLGCRWFFAAPEWTVVPKTAALSVALEVTDRPRILSRKIAYGYGPFRDQGRPRGQGALEDYEAWARHNGMASSFSVSTSHAWQGIILANQATFAQHPEYLALVKGVRRKPQLCVSNPAVRQLAVEFALAKIAEHPKREMVSMECSDGLNQCECADCVKMGGVSDRVFGLANHVAREIAKVHPGKLVGCLAYGEHSDPPTFDLEPNVYVQLTAGFNQGRYTHGELLELWPKRCRNLGFYEYMSVWLWDFDKLPGGRAADLTMLRTAIRRYTEIGGTSYLAETGNNWGLHGRGYYIVNKLLWNPDADVDALLADFYDKAFGPAAAAMQRYYERIAPDSAPLMSCSLIGEAFHDVDEATRLAHDLPDVLARLDQLKHYLRYVHLRWQADHEKDKTKQKKHTVAAMTAVYRTRYEYMNHWAAMRNTWAEAAAKQFNEPTWVMSDKSPKPWIIDQPVTQSETEQWFREGMEYFRPKTVTEVKFSNDLVPGGFTDTKPAATRHTWQRVVSYAMHSPKGEAIEVDFTTQVIPAYRNKPEANWTLRDHAGIIVDAGKLPQDGKEHHLTMKVPKPGTYSFEGNDSGSGWMLKAAPGSAVTLPNVRGKRLIHLGQMQEMFFFVPKSTRELHYFWNGGAHQVIGPDKKVIMQVSVDDDIVSVPVPEGMDGKVWSLSPRAQSQLWFFNAPNYLAASPSALLVPRDVDTVSASVDIAWPPPLRGAVNGLVSSSSADFLHVPAAVAARLKEKRGEPFDMAKVAPRVELRLHDALGADAATRRLWSSWGDIAVAADGRVYGAIGDHGHDQAGDARCFIYRWEPKTRRLKQIVDMNRVVPQRAGQPAWSKVHAKIDEAADGSIYFSCTLNNGGKAGEASYGFNDSLPGGQLYRFDPRTNRTEVVVSLPARRVTATSLLDRERNIWWCGLEAGGGGSVHGIDLGTRKAVHQGHDGEIVFNRAFALLRNGHLLFNGAASVLHLDPTTGKSSPTHLSAAGSPGMRCATRESGDSHVFGVMQTTHQLFRYTPKTDEMKLLGRCWLDGEYTTVCELSPDERFLYYLPGAHGRAWQSGTPVVQYNIATGRRKVLAFLALVFERDHDYVPAGTYGIKLGADASTLYVNFNGHAADRIRPATMKPNGFGLTAFAAIHIPASER